MLDLKALHEKLKELGEDLGSQAQDHQARVAAAIALLERADGLADRLEEYDALADKPWRLAIPAAGVTETFPLPTFTGPHTVVATDGSQITPSHHEIALCCLINIGRILYTYGTGELPLAEFLSVCAECGLEGVLSIELVNEGLRTLDLETYVPVVHRSAASFL